MKAVLIYLLFFIPAFVVGGWNLNYQFIAIGVLSFSGSLVLFHLYPNRKLIGLLLPLPFLLVYGGYIIGTNNFPRYPMWINALSGSYFSLIFYIFIKNRKALITASLIYTILTFVVGFTIFPAWRSTYANLESYKSSYLKFSTAEPVFKASYFNPINGNDVQLPAGKKKILLDFWGTWCVPCIQGIPDMEKLMKNNTDTGLAIYSCLTPSEDDTPAFIQKILKGRQGNFIMCRDSSILDDLRIVSVPRYMLIDRDGTVLYNGFATFGLTYSDNIYKIIKRFQ